jgi:transposase
MESPTAECTVRQAEPDDADWQATQVGLIKEGPLPLVRTVVVGLFLVLSAGCSSEQAANRPQDAQSQRTRDSTIAESNLPGAAGVRGALNAADAADARKAQIDSAGQTP